MSGSSDGTFYGWRSKFAGVEVLIQQGKTSQSANVDSFNGKFEDERLSEDWFRSLAHGRGIINCWRKERNEVRTQSSLGMTPSEFAAHHRAVKRGLATGGLTLGTKELTLYDPMNILIGEIQPFRLNHDAY